MATGTGKTRMALGLIYRLLKTRRARRILFLVDRDLLATQTFESFKTAPLDGTLTLTQIYDVQAGDASTPLPETRVHIATVQSLVRRVMYADSVFDVPRVDTYDVVIVDECHRGYALDRDLSEVELTFRDERAYLSKYRRVLDHFDAVRIGITATPALHTTEIFGRPIYEYGFRQAVLDGHLVDSDIPYRIETRLARDGIRYGVGDTVTVYNRTAQTVDLATLEDELVLDVERFNRDVITEGYNRAVCDALAPRIDPKGRGKTLIFCVDDAHADLVVRLLREALQRAHGPVEAAAVQKITGRSDDVKGLVRRYKVEQHPLVAVTVDLLTTGVDVPAITALVFLRMVRSRVLYEQMLGRATRIWREGVKETFAVYDAVGEIGRAQV
jgi:type I restriction enzyme R subunit